MIEFDFMLKNLILNDGIFERKVVDILSLTDAIFNANMIEKHKFEI